MNVELGTVEIDLGTEKVELDLDNLIPISDDISSEFREQPSLFAYVAMLAADAESIWRGSKRMVEETYAQTDNIVRDDFARDGERVTEKKVEMAVQLCRGYREAVGFELECHRQHLIMRVLQQALEMRADMLISLGANLRAEAQQTGMLIKQTKDKLEELRQQKT